MIKAIFFDWFNTLAYYRPSREELQSQVLKEFGIEVSPQQLIPGIIAADQMYSQENAISPLRQRSQEEQAKVLSRYQATVLVEAGVEVSVEPEMLLRIVNRAQQLMPGMEFVLYDDVLPTMKMLKEQSLIMGLLTNLDRDMKPLCSRLGLDPYLSFIVTSGEVGVDKPHPSIFQAALRQAGVDASGALHVGDQYQNDVVGARGAGIRPILIDRQDVFSEISDCPRICRLPQLADYLD